MSDRLCQGCGGRAMFYIEPVGEYDPAGWEKVAVCAIHLAQNVEPYVEALDCVQVSLITVGAS